MDPKRKSGSRGAAGVLGRPALLALLVVAVIATVLWQMNKPPQGSDVPGVVEGQGDTPSTEVDPSEVIEGSAEATDLETLEDQDAPDPNARTGGDGGQGSPADADEQGR